MAFLAVVYVTDRDHADAIASGDVEPHHLEGRIVGLYEFPKREELTCTGFCISKRGAGWGRHRDGFMICGSCGGRHVHTRRRVIGSLFQNLGINRLLRKNTPVIFQNPEGY